MAAATAPCFLLAMSFDDFDWLRAQYRPPNPAPFIAQTEIEGLKALEIVSDTV